MTDAPDNTWLAIFRDGFLFVLTVLVGAIGYWLKELNNRLEGRATVAAVDKLRDEQDAIENKMNTLRIELSGEIARRHKENREEMEKLRDAVHAGHDDLHKEIKESARELKAELGQMTRLLMDRLPRPKWTTSDGE